MGAETKTSEHKHEFSVMITHEGSFHACLECGLAIAHKDFMPGWEMRSMVDELLQYVAENEMPIPSKIINKYKSKLYDHVNHYMIPGLEDYEGKDNG